VRPLLDHAIRHLAGFERASASAGERRAAEWIAASLQALGCRVRIEPERAHGTYWWPLGLLTATGAAAGAFGARRARTRRSWRWSTGIVAGAAAAAIADDTGGGRLWFRRVTLPSGQCWNVVAQAGDRQARDTVVLVAHHDAARSGLVFHPAPARFIGARFPGLLERTNTTPPLMLPVVGGPLLVLAGAVAGRRGPLRAGFLLSLASAAAFAEIASRDVVPGANDNLTGVATLLGVAERLRQEPVPGLRVLLVSTGAEESFMEGMQGFARRHFPQLSRERTHFVCVDTVGSAELVQLEGEGMLRMRDYPAEFKDLVSTCAREVGVHLRRGLRFRNATDGLIPLRAGYPTVMLGSVNHLKLPDNYHWPTDTPDNVRLGTVEDAVLLCDAVVRRLATLVIRRHERERGPAPPRAS
jgi:hypothetical protein